ncbi:MAG: hypothetical protein ACE5M4_09195, partial [Anaerolineales bacterium]
MPKKIVIKIKARDGVNDFTVPLDFGLDNCCCCAVPLDAPQIKVRTTGARPMREVLDSLEQMYEDLYGGE